MSNQNSNPSVENKSFGPPPLPENWSAMSGDEKYTYLSTAWVSTEGRSFASAEIEAAYKRRAQRWLDVVSLKKPDRVPDYFLNGEYALSYGGCKPADRFYNQEKAAKAVYAFHQDFGLDYTAMGMFASGNALDILGYRLALWPGSRLTSYSQDMQFQYVEEEYMSAGDYDELISNMEAYALYKYVPRICDGLKSLAMGINPLKLGELGAVMPMLMPLAKGPLRQAIDTLLQAADRNYEDMQSFLPVAYQIQFRLGAPTIFGGASKAPFDILGDTMRGTRAIMLDMYRRPDKVVAACEALIPTSIHMAVQAAMFTRIPFITLFLHKGAAGFMSNDQFKKFYWPSLKASLAGMIDSGIIPLLFVQGSYDERLDIIAASDLPVGKTIWLFDRTDMASVKKKFGGFACFGGNVPSALFSLGPPEEMADYCKKLIDTAGADGGFFLSPGAAIDQARPENLHAFLKSVKEFG